MAEIKEKLSVVVPVLNSKDHLRDSLTSILAAVDRYRNAALKLNRSLWVFASGVSPHLDHDLTRFSRDRN